MARRTKKARAAPYEEGAHSGWRFACVGVDSGEPTMLASGHEELGSAMKTRSLMLSFVVGALLSTVAVAARAEEPVELKVLRPASDFPFFVGLSGGAGYATLSHPQVAEKAGLAGGTQVSFTSPAISLHGGYTIGERFSVGFEFSAVETGVSRDNPGESFQLGFSTKAICGVCHPRLSGVQVLATQMVLSTFGARVEYSLLGRDGLFVGATAGLASIVGLEDRQGFGATGRVGYRVRVSNVMTVSLEAGVQGQLYGDASLYMPYGAAVLRPYF